MKIRFTHLFGLLVIGGIGYFSWRTYHYFFDTGTPTIFLQGIESDGYYAGDVECILKGSDAYKVSTISVALDNKPLINDYAINSCRFDHAFAVPTRTLPNGKHTLTVQATSGTYAQGRAVAEIPFVVDNIPLQAAFVRPDSDYKVLQGRTLHIQFQVNKPIKDALVTTLSQTYPCFAESNNTLVYECFVPIACEEAPNEYLFSIDITDNVGNTLNLENKFQVVLFPFKKQTLSVKKEYVKNQKEQGKSEADFEAAIEQLSADSPQEKLWHGSFYAPIEIQSVSTDYGTVRTSQERGKYMHKAVDVLNTPRSVVWATQAGRVVMKDRFEHSGNTVIIDHGYGILSMFFHLEEFADIEVGDMIKRGKPVGTLGMTGYASGYHLHWEMRINNVPVDPLQWIKPNF